jgi:hypothetical protein
MLQVLHLNVSKVDRDIAHGMHACKERGGVSGPPHAVLWRGQRPWPSVSPLLGRSLASPTLLGALARLLRGHRLMLPSRIGRPSTSKELTMEQPV